MKPFDLSLYLVLDRGLCGASGMVETARAAVAGGVTLVQLRDKEADRPALIETGLSLKCALSGTGARLIVNDDIEAALAIGADGIHLGQTDAETGEARRRVGPNMIIGLSAETEDLVRAADPTVVDYLGIGPVFATQTKPDHKAPIGLGGLARLVAASPVPAVAIGGLKSDHVGAVLEAGAAGIAVVSAICAAPDPEVAARRFSTLIERARG